MPPRMTTITPAVSSSFMEIRKKAVAAGEGRDDDLVIAKAAARAWHHRGSGSHKKPLSEYLNMGKIPGPSPNKISANNKGLYNPSPLASKSSLLDAYEIEMISRQLDLFMESCEKNNNLITYGNYKAGQAHRDYRKRDTIDMDKQKKISNNGGLWSRYPVLCGTLQDVAKVKPTNYRAKNGSVHSTSQSKGMPRSNRNAS